MPKKLKSYEGHVQFEAVGVRVKASNFREAKKKIREQALKQKPKIDKGNFFVDEM